MSEPTLSQSQRDDLFVPFADHIASAKGWGGLVTTPAAIAGAVAVVAALLRVVVGSQSGASLAVGAAVGALIVALTLVYVQLRKRNAGIYLAGHEVGVVNAFGRRSRIDLAEVDHLHLCSVTGLTVQTTPLLLIVTRNGRVAKRFYRPDALQSGGLDDLAKRTGLPVTGSWDEQYTAAELQKRFPSALPPIQTISYAILQHPHRTAWIVGGVTIGAFIALTIILIARSSH